MRTMLRRFELPLPRRSNTGDLFSEDVRPKYGTALATLTERLPQIASDLAGLELVSAAGEMAELVTTRNGFAYLVYFVLDQQGIWKIAAM